MSTVRKLEKQILKVEKVSACKQELSGIPNLVPVLAETKFLFSGWCLIMPVIAPDMTTKVNFISDRVRYHLTIFDRQVLSFFVCRIDPVGKPTAINRLSLLVQQLFCCSVGRLILSNKPESIIFADSRHKNRY